jgi:hypothetical protein
MLAEPMLRAAAALSTHLSAGTTGVDLGTGGAPPPLDPEARLVLAVMFIATGLMCTAVAVVAVARLWRRYRAGHTPGELLACSTFDVAAFFAFMAASTPFTWHMVTGG